MSGGAMWGATGKTGVGPMRPTSGLARKAPGSAGLGITASLGSGMGTGYLPARLAFLSIGTGPRADIPGSEVCNA